MNRTQFFQLIPVTILFTILFIIFTSLSSLVLIFILCALLGFVNGWLCGIIFEDEKHKSLIAHIIICLIGFAVSLLTIDLF